MQLRRSLPLLFALLTVLTVFSACVKTDYETAALPAKADESTKMLTHILHPDAELRGVWIASVYNIDYPSAPDLTAEKLKSELDQILDTCEKNGLNTVFFQVRPACDALYESELFPVSSYLSSSGKLIFDPLEYLIEEGHRRNVRIHAWVNPLRVTVAKKELSSLPENSPARRNPHWIVEYADGKLYFNAGLPEVRDFIARGVEEIVQNYQVDGVVFDDYFYPYPVNDESGTVAHFDDDEAFALYGSEFENRADWRRSNINAIVKAVYETVHAIDEGCQFGVSPCGVWQNNNGSNGGSDTRGFEGYHSLYCDALAWIEGGYVDYISPQLYWTFETSATPYDHMVRWWNAALDGSNVKLYVSHASYRYEDGEWNSPEGQLTEQITFARSEKAYRGSVCYGYDEIKRNVHGASDDLISAYQNEIIYMDIVSSGRDITISYPAEGATTAEQNIYIIGMCDPYYPLTVTGGGMTAEKISLTKSGYFSLYVQLKEGENLILFEQNGKEKRLVIHRSASSLGGNQGNTGEKITVTDTLTPKITYPTSDVATSEGILWVQCNAPYGSTVTVNIGGVETALVPLNTPSQTWSADGYVSVSYGINAKLPSVKEGEILDCGKALFSLTHRDGNATAEGMNVRALGENALLCVRVKNEYTHLKITENSSYYNDYTVQSPGMIDYAVSQRNGFYRLRMGGYISETDVEEITDPSLFPSENGTITGASVYSNGKETLFRLSCTDKPPYNADVEDGRLVVTFYNMNAQSAPMPAIAENPLLKSCEIIRLEDRVRYSFELIATENFYGFDLYYDDRGAVLSMRNPVSPDLTAEKPLSGIRIVLDAGHGGYDRGASGAFAGAGQSFHEKDLNLAIVLKAAEKLEELGAEVLLTRQGDGALELTQRTKYLEEAKADLSLSIHQNSMNENVDITRIRGCLGLWCMDSGYMLSDRVGSAVAKALGRRWIGTSYQMLALCRNPKFPQALIEVGFITSVEEYELMTSGNGIEKAAHGIAEGVLDYFRSQAGYALP